MSALGWLTGASALLAVAVVVLRLYYWWLCRQTRGPGWLEIRPALDRPEPTVADARARVPSPVAALARSRREVLESLAAQVGLNPDQRDHALHDALSDAYGQAQRRAAAAQERAESAELALLHCYTLVIGAAVPEAARLAHGDVVEAVARRRTVRGRA